MVVTLEAEARKLVNGLPKQHKLLVDCPHTLVCREIGVKQFIRSALADSVGLLLRRSLFASEW
jgi:hypothetical protein